MFVGARRIKPNDGLRSVLIGGNMNLRYGSARTNGATAHRQLRRRGMIVAQEGAGTTRATCQSNRLKCYRARQAPSDAMSQVETAIDRARRVRSVLRGPSPACFGERLQRRPIRA